MTPQGTKRKRARARPLIHLRIDPGQPSNITFAGFLREYREDRRRQQVQHIIETHARLQREAKNAERPAPGSRKPRSRSKEEQIRFKVRAFAGKLWREAPRVNDRVIDAVLEGLVRVLSKKLKAGSCFLLPPKELRDIAKRFNRSNHEGIETLMDYLTAKKPREHARRIALVRQSFTSAARILNFLQEGGPPPDI